MPSQHTQLAYIVAQLRHAYEQLVNGRVTDTKHFAKGLIGPQIERLEQILATEDALTRWVRRNHDEAAGRYGHTSPFETCPYPLCELAGGRRIAQGPNERVGA